MPHDLNTHPIRYCSSCGVELSFDHSYGFHAGFADMGFLYNDQGDDTVIWSSYDPDYSALVGQCHPWMLSPEQRAKLETTLLPSLAGGAWRFSNPARCPQCGNPISGTITETIMGLFFDGCLSPDGPHGKLDVPFRTYLKT